MSRRRITFLFTGIAVVLLVGGGLLAGGALRTGGAPPASAAPLATASVERETLDATTQVDGTLGYADSYAPGGQAAYTIVNALATTGGADPTTLLEAYASAQAEYDSAVNTLAALRQPKATDVAAAQAQLAQVEATLQAAEQTAAGATPAQVAQAKAQLAAAQAGLVTAQQATQGPTPAQVAAAQANLTSAQAQLLSAQDAAAGPTAAQQTQAQAAVTEAQNTLTSDQAALAQTQAALAACGEPPPSPTPSTAPCDLGALQLAVAQAQSRVSSDQAQLSSAEAALSGLTSPASQAQAQANLASAQAAVNSAQSQLDALTAGPSATTQAQLASAQAAATSAQSALDALLRGDPAQAKATLASAQAQVNSAQTALAALLAPSATALQQASDAVSGARAGLAAAHAKLDAPSGVLTELAAVGAVVQPGGVLYTLDGTHPVVLMTGAVPAWRILQPGVPDGSDVQQLEADLQALGFAASSLTVDAHWDAQTTAAVKRWQHALGLVQSGAIPLGELVFEPGPLRVTAQSATLGTTLQAGTPVLSATTDERVVNVALDPALQTDVAVGDQVSVTLPDGSTTPGTVSQVGTVATAAAAGAEAASTPPPTIEVSVTLADPAAAGTLDQAPVTVNITTATATNVLAVPVGALVELLEGGYAVQVEQAGHLHYVAVQLGIFATGWVQVSGQGLAAGQTVVVAQ